MSDGETLIQTSSNNREAVSTLHCTLENGSDLHVNKRQKTRHYHSRSTEEEERKRMPNDDFLLCAARARKRLYFIHSFYWKSAVEHDGGV